MIEEVEQRPDSEYGQAIERLNISNAARKLLGLPAKNQISLEGFDPAEALPRYRNLTICIRAALVGFKHPMVKHMVDRNVALDEHKALEKVMAEGIPTC